MRFTDGYWKVREDCSLYQAGSAGEMEIRDDSVTIYASGVQNGGRKNLGGITLTVTFFSPAKDCIAVRAAHHFGGGQQVPAFSSVRSSPSSRFAPQLMHMIFPKPSNSACEA